MRKYCKAYPLSELRQFRGWSEKSATDEAELSDDSIGYLWDDFTVVKSPILDTGVIFDTVSPEWQDFCQNVLNFAIPEDLKFAYDAAETPNGVTA